MIVWIIVVLKNLNSWLKHMVISYLIIFFLRIEILMKIIIQ